MMMNFVRKKIEPKLTAEDNFGEAEEYETVLPSNDN